MDPTVPECQELYILNYLFLLFNASSDLTNFLKASCLLKFLAWKQDKTNEKCFFFPCPSSSFSSNHFVFFFCNGILLSPCSWKSCHLCNYFFIFHSFYNYYCSGMCLHHSTRADFDKVIKVLYIIKYQGHFFFCLASFT